jgi:hypothetical protein
MTRLKTLNHSHRNCHCPSYRQKQRSTALKQQAILISADT